MSDHTGRSPRRTSVSTRRAAVGLLACTILGPAVTGCGAEQDSPAPGAPATAATVTPSPGEDSTEGTVDVDVADLSEGPLPAVDVVVGSTLIHDRTEVGLRLPADALLPAAVGTYDGTPIISTGLGSQFYTAAADGTTTALGTEHETYGHGPRLVPATGHLLVFDNDRGTALSTYTVLDASTGEEVVVLRDTREQAADLGSLEPADRAVAAAVSGTSDPADVAVAVSPDGATTITGTTADPDDPDSPTVLTVGPPDGQGTQLRFATRTGDVAFEGDDAFLVALAVSSGDAVEPEYAVVRCTTEGACERATGSSPEVSIAGSGGVLLPG